MLHAASSLAHCTPFTTPIRAPARLDFGDAAVLTASSRGMETVLRSRRLLMSALRRVSSLDPAVLMRTRTDLLTRTTGICAEEVAEAVVDEVAHVMDRRSSNGLVDLLQGPGTIEMGDVRMELDGANVIFRHGRDSAEVDGVVAVGKEPDRLVIYDVTTSPTYLAEKLEGGEEFFQDLRAYFASRFGIALEKWHILMDYKRRGELQPFDSPIRALRTPESATVSANVHILALPLQRLVRQMRERVLSMMDERSAYLFGGMTFHN